MKSQYLCLPLLKNNPSAAGSAARRQPTPSLFDRIRVAVFRLIMLTTLSKGGGGGCGGEPAAASTPAAVNLRHHGGARSSPAAAMSSRSSYYYRAPYDDPHHSEALADCIEFLRKSSVMTTSFEDESGSASDQMVMPVIVM